MNNIHLSLSDVCPSSQVIIFSLDQPAAACGLAKSGPECANINSNMRYDATGPFVSDDWDANFSAGNVIKEDMARSNLEHRKEETLIMFDLT